jgi:acetyl CoA:N6-hydroxylysine acetyl transferase
MTLLDVTSAPRRVAVPFDGGRFELDAVPDDALPLLHQWMNDPEVDTFWELAGPIERTTDYLMRRRACAHVMPYLGLLDGVPMSYWEIYRADADPLAEHAPTLPHDAGVHLLLGPAGYRGRGLGSHMLRAVTRWILDGDARVRRVLAEPDVRNMASIRAFCNAGFRPCGTLRLPDKHALLMVAERDELPASRP